MAKHNKQIYEGEWKNGEPCGFGKVTSNDGSIYEGEMMGGQPHGTGIETYVSCVCVCV